MKPLEYHGTNKPYTALDVILAKQAARAAERVTEALPDPTKETLIWLGENAQKVAEGVYFGAAARV